MTLSEYLAITLPVIGPKMHPHTTYEYGRAVRRFTEWHGALNWKRSRPDSSASSSIPAT